MKAILAAAFLIIGPSHEPKVTTTDLTYLIAAESACPAINLTADKMETAYHRFMAGGAYGTRAQIHKTAYFRKVMEKTAEHFEQNKASACAIALDIYVYEFSSES